MPTEVDPIADKWYRRLDDSTEFKIVSIDEDEATLEIQHIDGETEMVDLDTWYEWDLKSIAMPEGWVGSSNDDLAYKDDDMEDEEWTESLEELRAKEDEDDWREEEE